MENQIVSSKNGNTTAIVKIAVAVLCGLAVVVGGIFLVKALMPKNVDNAPLNYIAVQEKAGKSWSIMDANGNIVVNEEYDDDDRVSLVSADGAYWVWSHKSSKYRLFSVKSPDKALTDVDYDNVTQFYGDIAYATVYGEPIVVINTDGEVVATLSKDVKSVGYYSADNDRACFQGDGGLYGFLNGDGEIVIKAKYTEPCSFHDGVAVVTTDSIENCEYSIIDLDGKELGTIDTEEYDILGFYSDDLMPARLKDGEEGLVYLDKKGKVAIDYSHKYSDGMQYVDGFAVVENDDDECCVIDREGVAVVRLGKYKGLYNLGDGLFIALKNEKVGIINSKDETIVDFKYESGLFLNYCRLGDNFFLERANNGTYTLLDKNGEKISHPKVSNISVVASNSTVKFYDLDELAEEMVEGIEKNGYASFDGKTKIADLANMYNISVDEVSRYSSNLELDNFEVGDFTVRLNAGFGEYLVEEEYHYTTVYSGWYSYQRRVSDGYKWKDIEYTSVSLSVSIDELAVGEALKAKIVKLLEAKGFTKVADGIYEAESSDGYYPNVSIENGGYMFTLEFAPYPEIPYCSFDDEEEWY